MLVRKVLLTLVPIMLVGMAGLAVVGCDDGCNLKGFQPQEIALVSASPYVAMDGGVCVIGTDLPVDVVNPDAYGQQLRHIGESVYACLKGTITTTTENYTPFYQENLWFRINGDCPSGYYGCFIFDCRTIETSVGHIGPQSVCPAGTPMDQWTDACWTQFYKVIGHEVMHGWLGRFHK